MLHVLHAKSTHAISGIYCWKAQSFQCRKNIQGVPFKKKLGLYLGNAVRNSIAFAMCLKKY